VIPLSPVTYRISAITYEPSNPGALFAFDIQNSEILLQVKEHFTASHLSPDGSLLVASRLSGDISLWKYTSDQGYTLLEVFPIWSHSISLPQGFQFSPALSSMLFSRHDFLEVQHLDGLAINPPVEANHHYDEFSTDGAYVVTASYHGQFQGHSTPMLSEFTASPRPAVVQLQLTGRLFLCPRKDKSNRRSK